MRLWCSASGGVAWSWTWQPYLGVWLFIALLAVAYARHLRRLDTPLDPGSRRQRTLYFSAGLITLWLALDWPLAALGAGYLASVHMLRYLLIALVAPPLLLLGVPEPTYQRLERRPRALAVLRNLTQPLVAFFLFNLIVSVLHWPSLVDMLMSNQLGGFVLDISWLLAGLIFWWPLISPVPAWPRFTHVWKLAYLGLNGILIRPVFLYLLFARFPAYGNYELAPPIAGTTALSDQQLAAGVMKLGTAAIMVTAMAFVFHAWTMEAGDKRERLGAARR
jgi:putative membrane protein